MKKLRVTVNGVSYDVEVEVLEDDDEGMGYGYQLTSLPSAPATPMARPAAPAAAPTASAPAARPSAPSGGGDSKVLTSPIAGIIVEIKVKEGSTVKENDPLVVIEAMKMNTNINSDVAGTVKEIKVKPGDGVQQGQVLMTFV
ncbi:MAG: biotin/lipoyl-binding protein [Chloroflexaceae bacterium]|nr:biotin/lipoyl-binding protein [Chloroflexaceae bacterium]